MSAPVGWDERSWLDVCEAERILRVELDHLRSLIGKEEPSADAIASACQNIERMAAVGAMAASWCKA